MKLPKKSTLEVKAKKQPKQKVQKKKLPVHHKTRNAIHTSSSGPGTLFSQMSTKPIMKKQKKQIQSLQHIMPAHAIAMGIMPNPVHTSFQLLHTKTKTWIDTLLESPFLKGYSGNIDKIPKRRPTGNNGDSGNNDNKPQNNKDDDDDEKKKKEQKKTEQPTPVDADAEANSATTTTTSPSTTEESTAKPVESSTTDSDDKTTKKKVKNILDLEIDTKVEEKNDTESKSKKPSLGDLLETGDKKLAKKLKKKKSGDDEDKDKDDEDDDDKKKDDKDDDETPEEKKKRERIATGINVGAAVLVALNFLASFIDQFKMSKILGNSHQNSYEHFRSTFLPRGDVDRMEVYDKYVTAVLKKAQLPELTAETVMQMAAQQNNNNNTNSNGEPIGEAALVPVPTPPPTAQTTEEYYTFQVADMNVFARQFYSDILQFGVQDVPIFHPFHWTMPLAFSYAMLLGTVWFSAKRAFALPKNQKSAMDSLFTDMTKMGDKKGEDKAFTVVKDIETRFKDVAGMDEAKGEIMEFVDFLKNPAKYHDVGARLPKGALLHGPPGTGKTLLAKAIAGEAECPFISVSGSDFSHMYVGMGSKKVRDLFKQARKLAPCIIFIDEVDAIARQRDTEGSHEEREATLNQLLVEMDGFKKNEKIIIMAATNRLDILDKAFTRPGRIDRKIMVDAPDLQGRQDILKVHLKKIRTQYDFDDLSAKLAALTPGMVGADLANICNEAAILAARESKDVVELVDFERAIDRVIGGLEKKRALKKESLDRTIVAYHESGHAVAGWFLESADPLLKVTIVPRTNGALGFAQYLPKENGLKQTDELLDRMCVTLAGRAAEEIFFNKISTGASDDLKKVTNTAQQMITDWGMSEKLPNMAFPKLDEYNQLKPMSDATAEVIDQEINDIVSKQYARAKELLKSKEAVLKEMSEALLQKETLNHDDIVAILGPRPFADDDYKIFIEKQKEKLSKTEKANEIEPPPAPKKDDKKKD